LKKASELVLTARAKVNIGLRITGVRSDGYHEIRSILQEIHLYDTILLHPAPDFSISMTCDDPDLPTDESNLCVRAAQILKRAAGRGEYGVQIRLIKRIPTGAGLGGGSSDAAAVLKGLNQFWELNLPPSELLKPAARLGSDVPFFILGGCCAVSGRGEKLRSRPPVIRHPLLLIVPKIRISTKWAYKNIKNYHLTSKRENIIFNGSKSDILTNPALRRFLTNDFEPLVFQHYPPLGEIKELLLRNGAFFASLSGSGSSVYGVFENTNTAKQAIENIRVDGASYLLEP
jgi:4-diphosphocytidyl-2-C-methyl-D-erythritol kinase